jgi:hypothetical protein
MHILYMPIKRTLQLLLIVGLVRAVMVGRRAKNAGGAERAASFDRNVCEPFCNPQRRRFFHANKISPAALPLTLLRIPRQRPNRAIKMTIGIGTPNSNRIMERIGFPPYKF